MLNFLLRRPGARVGVIVNDFGAVNIHAGLVSGQIDEPTSIAGDCICCLPDAGGLNDALAKLTHPRLGLDVVFVEASGLAEPTTLARLVRLSPVERVRPGGVIEIVDAGEYFATLDNGLGPAPLRFEAAPRRGQQSRPGAGRRASGDPGPHHRAVGARTRRSRSFRPSTVASIPR